LASAASATPSGVPLTDNGTTTPRLDGSAVAGTGAWAVAAGGIATDSADHPPGLDTPTNTTTHSPVPGCRSIASKRPDPGNPPRPILGTDPPPRRDSMKRQTIPGTSSMTTKLDIPPTDPIADFRNEAYLRINARRLEHLATLALPLRDRTVLELGAGIGDLTEFFLDRGCSVTSVEGRAENLDHLATRYAQHHRVRVEQADLNNPPRHIPAHEIVFADGILYHLSDPARFIGWCAKRTEGLLILSTCVSDASGEAHGPTDEDPAFASQALDGKGCRPSRHWIHQTLRQHFAHAGMTRTQPNHPEFPTDWHAPVESETGLSRAVFVASHQPLTAFPQIADGVLDIQRNAP